LAGESELIQPLAPPQRLNFAAGKHSQIKHTARKSRRPKASAAAAYLRRRFYQKSVG